MAHGKNASDWRSRERAFWKGIFKSYKHKFYMTDKKAIAFDLKANDNLTQEELNIPCYFDEGLDYSKGYYDYDIYGYNRSKQNACPPQNLNFKRKRVRLVA